MAQASQRIGILHLSDVQFGPNHRFTKGVDSLTARLIPALRALPDAAPSIDVVVFSGDAAEHGLPDQFADAARFLTEVLEVLELDAERLVVVPGNHDISRDAVKAQIYAARAEGDEARLPFERKWDNYRAFLHALRGDGGSDELTEVRRFPELGLTVSALNSTVEETADEHYGFCGEEQLEARARELAAHPGDIRVAVVHHNVRQAAPDDAENLRDEEDLVRVLGAHVDLVLHGHRHAAGRDYLSNGRLILSTGSAALKREQRPDETPNQFQVLGLSRTAVERWAYCFDPKDKRWVVDATIEQDGVVGYESIALGAPGRAPAPPPRPPARMVPAAPVEDDPLAALAEEPQLDDDAVARFRADLRDDADGLRDSALTPMELLGRMNLLRGGAMTVGAALLFGRRPQRELPAALVQCVRYLGEEVTAERESIRLEGTARAQVDEALRFLRERIPRRERPGTETARAQVTYAYPMACLREVIVNAIVHRDYGDAGRIVHVRLFSDRIEIASPGAWCTERDIDGGRPLADAVSQSVKRNPRLAHAMTQILYFEGEGSGIRTAVADAAAMRATPPRVRMEDGFAVVTVFPARLDADAVDALRERAQTRSGTMRLPASRLRASLDAVYMPQQVVPSDGGDLLDADQLLTVSARRLLLQGEPGVGKSTLLARLARDLAHSQTVIPIAITARDVAQVRPDAIELVVRDLWPGDTARKLSAEAFRGIFEHSSTVLLVDGLDEVGDQEQRSHAIDVVATTIERFPRARAVVATRPAGLPSATVDWKAFTLLPWSEQQAIGYLRTMSIVAGLTPDAARDLVHHVSCDPQLLTLAKIPLLGAAIVSNYETLGHIPTSRFELLRAATDVLVERWDTERGVASAFDTRVRRDVLRVLASRALDAGLDPGTLPWDWCRAKVWSIARYLGIGTDELLRSVADRGSLALRAEDNTLAFPSPALAELLAAEELESSGLSDDELFREVIRSAAEPRLRTVGELALLIRQRRSHQRTLVPRLLRYAARRSEDAQLLALDLAAAMITEGDDSATATTAFLRAARGLSRQLARRDPSSRVNRVLAQLTHASPD